MALRYLVNVQPRERGDFKGDRFAPLRHGVATSPEFLRDSTGSGGGEEGDNVLTCSLAVVINVKKTRQSSCVNARALKRDTARCITSTLSGVLPLGVGVPHSVLARGYPILTWLGGYPILSWPGGYPILTWPGVVCQPVQAGGGYPGVPPPGTVVPTERTWDK